MKGDFLFLKDDERKRIKNKRKPLEGSPAGKEKSRRLEKSKEKEGYLDDVAEKTFWRREICVSF